jgi:hypothetical protein
MSEPFPCPQCGETVWIAHYQVPESQGIELFIGADGRPEAGEYDGSTKAYDPEPDDYYQCDHCGAMIDLDGNLSGSV